MKWTDRLGRSIARRDLKPLPRANTQKSPRLPQGSKASELGRFSLAPYAAICLVGSAIGASRSQNSVRISATIQHAAPSRSKKFPRLKPRLNGNFSLGLVSTALKIQIYEGDSGAPGTIRTSDPQIYRWSGIADAKSGRRWRYSERASDHNWVITSRRIALTPKNSTIKNRGQLLSFLFAGAPNRTISL